jgi:hypothetical protein
MYIFAVVLILIILFRNIDMCSVIFTDKLKNLKITSSPVFMNIAYNLLYCFSWCQIQLYKIKNNVSSKLKIINVCCHKYLRDKCWVVDIIVNEMIIIDNDGNELCKLYIKNKNTIEEDYSNLKYAGIILLDKDINTNCINHIFYEKIPKKIDYKVSKLKFMSIELHYNNNNYLIDLKNNDNNYYIVNNYLNEFFFKYYIKNILNLNINQDNFDYNVTIIDNDVNIINLLPHQTIKIDDDNYEIYPIEHIESSNDEHNMISNHIVLNNKEINNNDNEFYNKQTDKVDSYKNLIENKVFIDKMSENSDSDDKSCSNSIIYDSDDYVKLDTNN